MRRGGPSHAGTPGDLLGVGEVQFLAGGVAVKEKPQGIVGDQVRVSVNASTAADEYEKDTWKNSAPPAVERKNITV